MTAAAGASTLDTALLSVIFGQGRSDHVNFIANGVPAVFLTDATNACYHTAQDDVTAVDFDKLDQQVATATALLADLASTDAVPVFDPAAPVATYDDALALLSIAEPAEADFSSLGAEGEALSTQLLVDLQAARRRRARRVHRRIDRNSVGRGGRVRRRVDHGRVHAGGLSIVSGSATTAVDRSSRPLGHDPGARSIGSASPTSTPASRRQRRSTARP